MWVSLFFGGKIAGAWVNVVFGGKMTGTWVSVFIGDTFLKTKTSKSTIYTTFFFKFFLVCPR